MSRISRDRPGSFMMNSASSGIKPTMGQEGYAFKDKNTSFSSSSAADADKKHVPAYSLPAKPAPSVPMPRAYDVINGVPPTKWTPAIAPSQVNGGNDVTHNLNKQKQHVILPSMPKASQLGPHHTSYSNTQSVNGVHNKSGTVTRGTGNRGVTAEAHYGNHGNYVNDHHQTAGAADTLRSPFSTNTNVIGVNINEIDGKQQQSSPLAAKHSISSSGSAREEDSVIGDDTSYSAENQQLFQQYEYHQYTTQHYGRAPADLDLLMEAAKWTKNDDADDPPVITMRGLSSISRGSANIVRASIEAFTSADFFDAKKRAAQEDERGRVVVYTTSVSAIRRRKDSCARALHILHTHGVAFEARDIFISREHMDELRQRLQVPVTQPDVDVPQIFISGIYLGGIEELERFNEAGHLKQILAPMEKVSDRPLCEQCYGHRYVICVGCNGSRKSKSFYRTGSVFAILRCAQCDENGMVPCQLCNPNFRPSARQSATDLASLADATK